jgi:monoamine oxidase
MSNDPSNPHPSRRRFLGQAAISTAGAGLLASQSAVAAASDTKRPGQATCDVIVVGAGFSGLAAACKLTRAGKSVVVLEARDRVGGRTKPGQVAGQTIDLGGMWVGPTQTRLLALSDEYGVRRYVSPIEGNNITEIRGVVSRGPRDLPGLSGPALQEFLRVMQQINGMSATVPVETPWTAPNARDLDGVTIGQWFSQATTNTDARALLDALSSAIFVSDKTSLSMLYFLFYIRSGDDLKTLMSVGDGAQRWLYFGGVHQIARKIAADLGERVVLKAPVRRIVQSDSGVVVTSDAGEWRAKRVIVAVPPALCERIDFQPALPALRAKLTQRFPMGSVIKFWVAYERPFWRAGGLNGMCLSDTSPTGVILDATPDGASVGLLAGFFEGEKALIWGQRTQAERRATVIGEVTRMLGPEGARAIDYIDNDWPSEEWSRGCYGGMATPGTLSLFGEALRRAVGRISWAGTETSPVWTGYIDGAIRAGERAAYEALAGA